MLSCPHLANFNTESNITIANYSLASRQTKPRSFEPHFPTARTLCVGPRGSDICRGQAASPDEKVLRLDQGTRENSWMTPHLVTFRPHARPQEKRKNGKREYLISES